MNNIKVNPDTKSLMRYTKREFISDLEDTLSNNKISGDLKNTFKQYIMNEVKSINIDLGLSEYDGIEKWVK